MPLAKKSTTNQRKEHKFEKIFSGLQLCRYIFMLLLFQICEIPRNSPIFELIAVLVHPIFLLVINSNFGRVTEGHTDGRAIAYNELNMCYMLSRAKNASFSCRFIR